MHFARYLRESPRNGRKHFPVGSLHTASILILILMQSKRLWQSLTIWCPMAVWCASLPAASVRSDMHMPATPSYPAAWVMPLKILEGDVTHARRRLAGYPPVCSVSVPRPWQRLPAWLQPRNLKDHPWMTSTKFDTPPALSAIHATYQTCSSANFCSFLPPSPLMRTSLMDGPLCWMEKTRIFKPSRTYKAFRRRPPPNP